MIITNFQNLAKNNLRKKALEIAEAGYEAIEIKKVVLNKIKIENNILKIIKIPTIPRDSIYSEIEFDLNNFKRIFIVGIGKGSALASATLAEILGNKLSGGIALDIKNPDEFKIKNLKLEILIGIHPLPSQQNIEATKKIIELADGLDENDLLINFICGGGSALACASEKEMEDSIKATKLLTKSGATIDELNIVRKHLSEFKGGGFAKIACPATILSLIISDVCGNDLSTVASGPTVFDKTTVSDAENVLKKYGLNLKDFNLYETPKDKKCFEKVSNILFACNQDAIMGMLKKSEELGLKSEIHSLALQGEAREVLFQMMSKINNKNLLIAAGETTVAFKKFPAGKGGRNQEAVLGALANRQIFDIEYQDAVFLSFASDGHDNTEAAGAIGDGLTVERAKELNLNIEEFLENHNSFEFFEKTGDLIFAENKCFNVADLMLVLKSSK
ncbi:MAG: DUF4147 domain-containing protein [Patescibacteria group bacterium]